MKLRFRIATAIVAVFFFCIQFTKAQDAQASIDSTFMLLNQSQIPTGILYDKAIHLSAFSALTGASDTSIITDKNWMQIYLEVYNGSFDRSNMEKFADIKQRARDYMDKNNNAVPLLILDYNYNRIKADAIDSNLLTFQGGRVMDVPNRNQSPYSSNRVFTVAPFLDNLESSNVTFYIGQDFYFTNQYSTPSFIEIDFGDGTGYRTVNWGTSISISYSDVATKIIRTRITNEEQQLRSSSSIASSLCSGPGFPDPDVTWNLTATIPYNNQYATAKAYIKYGGLPNVLDKPLVFVEGIDFGYNHYPTRNGDFGWCAFWGSQSDYPELGQMPIFLNALLADGYDIILLDFNDGADYIQKNAFVFTKLIETINSVGPAMKDQTVVIGASMGGQVARYGLDYMEENNLTTCCREYISFDAPQQGANISLGLQYFLDFFGSNATSSISAPMSATLDDDLNRHAAKQLLDLHYSRPNYSGNNSPNDASQLHSQYFSEINTLGYPQHLRKVAISNGSANAVSQGYNAGDELVHWQWNPLLCSFTTVIRGEAYSVGPQGLIFTGKVFTTQAVFLLTPGICAIDNGLGIFFYSNAVLGTSHPSYDNCPGGFRSSSLDLANGINDGIDQIPPYEPHPSHAQSLNDNQAFIPLVSSLDINTNNLFFNANTLLQPTSQPIPALYPFEAYYAPPSNQPHVFADGTLGGNQAFGNNATPGGNLEWGLEEILKGENKLVSPLSISNSFGNNGVYNYARPEDHFIGSVDILNGGNLYINANLPSDYGANTNPLPPPPGIITPTPGSTFTLETNGCGSVIHIQNGGTLILGDPTTGNKAKFIFHKGSILIIDNGGQLIINDNSSLVIEDGARLEFINGGQIQLLGHNAVLDIKGILQLNPNADFTFTHPNFPGGYVKFSRAGYITYDVNDPNYQIQLVGTGQRMDFLGLNNHDKVLEIAQDAVYVPDQMSAFTTKKCETDFSSGGLISIGCPNILLSQTRFLNTSSTAYSGRGVVVWGQANTVISFCIFDNLGTGLTGNLFDYQSMLTLTSCQFLNCGTGAYVDDKGVKMLSCTFDKCGTGLSTTGLTLNSNAVNSRFTNSYENGAYLFNGPVEFMFNQCKLNQNGLNGVFMSGGTLSLHCSDIKQNLFAGFDVEAGGALNMNPVFSAGYNNAKDNVNYTGYFDQASFIEINGGYNDLVSANSFGNCTVNTMSNCPLDLFGTILFSCNLNNYPFINEYNNKWKNTTSNFMYPYPFYYSNYVTDLPYTSNNLHDQTNSCFIRVSDPQQSQPQQCPMFHIVNPQLTPLGNCTNCSTINTFTFQNTPIDSAARTAIHQMDTTVVNGYANAVGMFNQILMYPVPDSSGNIYVRRESIRKMHESLGDGINSGQINWSQTSISPQAQNVIQVETNEAQIGVNTFDYERRFYSTMRLGMAYRASGKRDAAINTFQNVLSFALPSDTAYVDKWLCLTTNENLVLTGQMAKEQFITAIENCNVIRKAPANVRMSNVTNEDDEDEITTGTLNTLSVFPNPANDLVSLVFNQGDQNVSGTFLLYSVDGRLVIKQTIVGGEKGQISVADLPEGIYVYQFVVDGQMTDKGKISVAR